MPHMCLLLLGGGGHRGSTTKQRAREIRYHEAPMCQDSVCANSDRICLGGKSELEQRHEMQPRLPAAIAPSKQSRL